LFNGWALRTGQIHRDGKTLTTLGTGFALGPVAIDVAGITSDFKGFDVALEASLRFRCGRRLHTEEDTTRPERPRPLRALLCRPGLLAVCGYVRATPLHAKAGIAHSRSRYPGLPKLHPWR